MFQPPRILVDALNRALLILALVAGLISLFFAYGTVPRLICTGVLAACILLAVFRLFSANRARRAQENQRFLTMTTAVREFFRRPRSAKTARKNPTWSEIKHYKYLICPQCTQRLRVPRGKGRLIVTCTRCGNRFETKS